MLLQAKLPIRLTQMRVHVCCSWIKFSLINLCVFLARLCLPLVIQWFLRWLLRFFLTLSYAFMQNIINSRMLWLHWYAPGMQVMG